VQNTGTTFSVTLPWQPRLRLLQSFAVELTNETLGGGQRLLLALPIFLCLAPLFLNAPGFRFSLSALRSPVSAFQVLASNPSVGVQPRQGEQLVAGLCDPVFHSEPGEHLLSPIRKRA